MTSELFQASGQTSRRAFLTGVTALGISATLAGCTRAPEKAASTGSAGVKFSIPDAPAGFPAKDVTVRVLSPQDEFWNALAPAYHKKFSNVTVKEENVPAKQRAEVVPLGFRNKTSHDITQLVPGMQLPTLVASGLLAPLNEIIPDFDKWQDALPAMGKVEGVQVFDGKQYQVAPVTEQRHQFLTFYNKKLLDKAGFDPSSEPLTWDSFREVCRKVTKAGNGRAYGFALEINQLDRLRRWFLTAALMAGLKAGDELSLANGEYIQNAPEMLEAIELVQAIQKDGSMFPGSASLTATEVWARVVRGNAAICSAGPWVCTQWQQDEPDFKFGVAQMPVGNKHPYPPEYPPFGANALQIPSFSKVKDVAGNLLGYATSVDGQTQLGKIEGVGNPPYLPQAQKAAAVGLTKQEKMCLKLASEMTYGPQPVLRNADIAFVQQRLKPPEPNLGKVIQAILVGDETNPKKALTKLKDDSDRALDAAIADAKKLDGSTATRADYVFPDWDPRKDYTLSHYKNR